MEIPPTLFILDIQTYIKYKYIQPTLVCTQILFIYQLDFDKIVLF